MTATPDLTDNGASGLSHKIGMEWLHQYLSGERSAA